MHINRLVIRNFRSIKSLDLDLEPGMNVLIGKNNSGKSNIIRALELLLGEKWPTYQEPDESWFFASDGNHSPFFVIAASLTPDGLPITDSERFIWYTESGSGPDWDTPDSLPDPGRHRMTLGEFSQLIRQAIEITLFLIMYRTTDRSPRFGLAVRCPTGRWRYFYSLSRELRDALLTTALVPAFRDPGQQLRITNYTWYGKLIRALYNNRTEEQAAQIQDLQRQLKEITDSIFQDSTSALRDFLSEVVFHHRIRFQIGSDLRDDIYKQISLFIDDGIDGPFYEKGSGIQSALIIGLFTHYCKTFHRGSSLLLVEEPELYLHPQARRAIESRLVDFVQDPGAQGKRQLILCTHSPEFLRSVPLHGVVRVYKDPVENCTHTIKISDLDKDTLHRYRQVVQTKSTEMFFADKCILVEGGEEYILPALADCRFGRRGVLDSNNISVIRTDGKDRFPIYIDVLDRLGIEWFVLADLDFLIRGLERFSDRLNNRTLDLLEQLRRILGGPTNRPKGRDVRNALDPQRRDWVALYEGVDRAISRITSGEQLSEEECTRIRTLWDQLRDRIEKVSTRDAIDEADCGGLVDDILSELRHQRFYILRSGDLEDCFTNEAMDLEDSKDRRALAVAQKIACCRVYSEVKKWIGDLSVFEDLLDDAVGQSAPLKTIEAEDDWLPF